MGSLARGEAGLAVGVQLQPCPPARYPIPLSVRVDKYYVPFRTWHAVLRAVLCCRAACLQVELRTKGEAVEAVFYSPAGEKVGSYAVARRMALAAHKGAGQK